MKLLPFVAQSLYGQWIEEEGAELIAEYTAYKLAGNDFQGTYEYTYPPEFHFNIWCFRKNEALKTTNENSVIWYDPSDETWGWEINIHEL